MLGNGNAGDRCSRGMLPRSDPRKHVLTGAVSAGNDVGAGVAAGVAVPLAGEGFPGNIEPAAVSRGEAFEGVDAGSQRPQAVRRRLFSRGRDDVLGVIKNS